MTFHVISIRLAVAKNTIPNVEDAGGRKFPHTVSDYKLIQSLWTAISNHLTNLILSTPKDPSKDIAKCIPPEKYLYPTHKNPHVRMFWAEPHIEEIDIF